MEPGLSNCGRKPGNRREANFGVFYFNIVHVIRVKAVRHVLLTAAFVLFIELNSQVDGPLQRERFSGPAHVFVPELNGPTARPAGGRATRRHDCHL